MIAPDKASAPLMEALTPAERIVAAHLALGLCNKEISALLGKAEPTIKHQVSSIMEKTGTPSRSRFIALYYQHYFASCPSAIIGAHGIMPRVAVNTRRSGQCNVDATPPPANVSPQVGAASLPAKVRLIA